MQRDRLKLCFSQGFYVVFCILVGGILGYFLYQNGNSLLTSEIAPYTEEGVKRLKLLEEVSVSDVLAQIEAQQEPVVKDGIEIEDVDFKRYYQQSIFMGDSIVEAFESYNYLDASSVVAKVGLRLATAETEVQTVINLNPQEIFLLFGANDLLVYKTEAQYIERYKALIDELVSGVPTLEIYIISIFPVEESVAKETPELSLERVMAYNDALIQMCEESGYAFIDVGSYVTDEMYEPDGIHVKAKFYPIWMQVVKDYREAESK